MNLFFDPDLAASYREIALRLERCARRDEALAHLGTTARARYASALRSNSSNRDRAWRDFIGALDAFVSLCDRPSTDLYVLRDIVAENRDLLETARPAA